MAGLQYSFFPTDFYYPRPQSVPVKDAARAAALTSIQTQKKEVSNDDLEWPRSIGFRVQQGKNITQGSSKLAGVSMHRNQGKAYVEDQGKLVKYSSPYPLSWFTLIPQELSDSS